MASVREDISSVATGEQPSVASPDLSLPVTLANGTKCDLGCAGNLV